MNGKRTNEPTKQSKQAKSENCKGETKGTEAFPDG
jgi:hypothetical protein